MSQLALKEEVVISVGSRATGAGGTWANAGITVRIETTNRAAVSEVTLPMEFS
jgi:hypothetical protein